MATLKNTIAKLEKATGQKCSIKLNGNNRNHSFDFCGWKISFYPNGGYDGQAPEASALYVTKIGGIEDDITTDYFGGTFCDNANQAIRLINNMNKF